MRSPQPLEALVRVRRPATPRVLPALALSMLVGWAGLALADDPPILRYTSYVLLAAGDQPGSVSVESRSYGALNVDHAYADQPSFAIIAADGRTLEEVDGTLGRSTTLSLPASRDVTLLALRPGNNYAIVAPARPHAFVATTTAPLNVVRGFPRLHFWVPRGAATGSVYLHAFSVGEAVRAVVYAPDGSVAAELEDDFNEPRPVGFSVPPGLDGRAWSVGLLEPRHEGWKIDDCKVWLSDSLPGLLAPSAEWAEALSRPFAVEWRPLLDFEQGDPVGTVQWNEATPAGGLGPTYGVTVSDERPHSGARSLRVELAFPEGAARHELKIFTRPLAADGVQRVRLWLYGDGSGRRLTIRVRDHSQEHHYYTGTAITWTGWGEVVADFARGPVSVSGGDGNHRIDGPQVSLVIQIGHAPGQPRHSVYYLDDVTVSP